MTACSWVLSSFSWTDCLTFATSDDRHIAGSSTAVKNDWSLTPWDEKVCAFTNYFLLDTPEAVKDNCPVTSIHCTIKQRLMQKVSNSYEKTKQKISHTHTHAHTHTHTHTHTHKSWDSWAFTDWITGNIKTITQFVICLLLKLSQWVSLTGDHIISINDYS